MSKIKSILAFAALMLCGGAWAATPIAEWAGNFSVKEKGANGVTFTIPTTSAVGDTAITISDAPVFVQRSGAQKSDFKTKLSVVVRYSSYPTLAADTYAPIISIHNNYDKNGNIVTDSFVNIAGICGDNAGNAYEIWGSSAYRQGTTVPRIKLNATDRVGLVYDSGDYPFAVIGNGVAYPASTTLKASNRWTDGFYLGGGADCSNPVTTGTVANETYKGPLAVANGLVITGIAVFDDEVSEYELASYSFSDENPKDVTYYNCVGGSSGNHDQLSNYSYKFVVPASAGHPEGSYVQINSVKLGLGSSRDAYVNDVPKYMKIGDFLSGAVNGNGTVQISTFFPNSSYPQTYSFTNARLAVGQEYTVTFYSDAGLTAKNTTMLWRMTTTEHAKSFLSETGSNGAADTRYITQEVNFSEATAAKIGAVGYRTISAALDAAKADKALIVTILDGTTTLPEGYTETCVIENGQAWAKREVYARNTNPYSYHTSNDSEESTKVELRTGDTIVIDQPIWSGGGNGWKMAELESGYPIKIIRETDIGAALAIPEGQDITITYKNYPQTGDKKGVYLKGDIGANVSIDGAGALFLGMVENKTIADGVTISCDVGFQSSGKHQALVENATLTLECETYNHVAGSSIKLNSGSKIISDVELPNGAIESNVSEKTVDKQQNSQGKWVYTLIVPPAATVVIDGETRSFTTLAAAISAAKDVATIDNKQTVTLIAASNEDVDIPANVTLDTNKKAFTGTVSGAGEIVYDGQGGTTVPSFTIGGEWTGVITIKNFGTLNTGNDISVQTNLNDLFTKLGSRKVKFSGVAGWYTGNTYPTVLILEDGENQNDDTGSYGWRNDNGSYNVTSVFPKLSGKGTFRGTRSQNQMVVFQDTSDFEGAMNITGKRVTIDSGSSNLAGATGQIYVKTSAKIASTWTATGGLVVDGAGTISGTGTIDAVLTLKDGATIDVTDNEEDEALTLGENATVSFGSSLKLVGADSGDVILKGILTRPDVEFITVKFGNENAPGHLAYSAAKQAIIYTEESADYWTPKASSEGGRVVFEWTTGSAWTDYNGQDAAWPSDGCVDGEKINVKFDAKDFAGVVINGQVMAGDVVVECSDGENHDFEFHNPTQTVDGSIEVDETNKLTANSILMPQHRGNLGLKVPIVGEIGFSDNTHLVFRTGTGSKVSEAYGYNVNTHDAAIIVDLTNGEAGKFLVPSTMYAQPFEVKENATIVFDTTTNVTGTYTGAGKLAKMGSGTTTITSVRFPSGGIEVIGGTLKLQKSGNYPFWDGAALPVKVFGGATLDINGYEGFKSTITLEAGATLASNDATRNLTYDNASIASVSLNGDATVHAAGNFGILRNGRGETSFALNGHKLTKTGNGSFFLCNTTVASDSTGSIDVQAGRLAIWNKAVNVSSVDVAFADGTSLAMSANLTAHDVTITGAVTITSDSSGTLSGSSIKLTTATSTLTVPTKLADDAVTTDLTGKVVVFNETTLQYSVSDADVEKAFESVVGSSASGWFADWSGEKEGAARSVITGSGLESKRMVYHDGEGDAQKWHPYRGDLSAKNAYTMSVYGTTDLIVPENGKYKVLWAMGNPGNSHILAKDEDGNIVFFKNSNGDGNTGTQSNKISAGKLSGYHLITVTFSTTKGAAIWVDGEKKASDDTFTTAANNGLQIGGVFQGTYSPMKQGVGYVPTYIWAAEAVAPAGQIAALSEAHPAATTFNTNVAFTTDGGKLYLPSMTNTSGNLFQVKKGTLVVPKDVVANLDRIEMGDNGDSNNYGIDLDGTLNLAYESTGDCTVANIYVQAGNNNRGLLFGEWTGVGTYNIRGTFSAPNAWAELIHDAGKQTYNIDGGTFVVKGVVVKQADKVEINLTNGGTINLGSVPSTSGNAIIKNFTKGTVIGNGAEYDTLNVTGAVNLQYGSQNIRSLNIANGGTATLVTNGDQISYDNPSTIHIKGTLDCGSTRQTLFAGSKIYLYNGGKITGEGGSNNDVTVGLDTDRDGAGVIICKNAEVDSKIATITGSLGAHDANTGSNTITAQEGAEDVILSIPNAASLNGRMPWVIDEGVNVKFGNDKSLGAYTSLTINGNVVLDENVTEETALVTAAEGKTITLGAGVKAVDPSLNELTRTVLAVEGLSLVAKTGETLITIDGNEYVSIDVALKHLHQDSTVELGTGVTLVDGIIHHGNQTFNPLDYLGYEIVVAEDGTMTASRVFEGSSEVGLVFSEIMPKPVDKPVSAANPDSLARYDENGLESGWVELENKGDKWVDLANYKFLRVNRSKATSKGDYGNFPSVLIPPHSKYVFYTSERYSNSADMTVSAWNTPAFTNKKGEADPKPKLYGPELHNMLVWPDKVNPKKFAFVRLLKGETIIDTVVIPSDIPEGHSIIVTSIADDEATVRYMTNKPTKGEANTSLEDESIVKLGPNVGPLYEIAGGAKHDSASEFGEVAMAKAEQDYTIKFALNPTMSPTEAAAFREADGIRSIKLVYRTWNEGTPSAETEVEVNLDNKTTDAKDQGDQYTTAIPSSALPNAGELIQWKFKVVDNANNEWTTPSFHNKDDGYEWYGTIVEPNADQMSATLPTWHMFVDSASKAEMDKDAPNQALANNARVAIYDSSTSTYYDYVRIDLRGNTSARFNKKSHGLRFSKVNPMRMKDVVTGETHEGIRKTSLIAEPSDPSRMRQMIAFWLWNKMGNKVPFDFPVRCNLNGAFYQLAFNSERFTDELIEDVYGFDKFGYGYKNVGTLKSKSGTTAGSIEKKTPDDGVENDFSVLEDELRALITAANNVSNDKTGANKTGLENAELTKVVVERFDLPAWLNYLASARITQETDDVWANISIYYDNPTLKEENAYRGTGTWMPLGYDFNLTFGQYYDTGTPGMRADKDWFKSHPFYGGNRVRCYKNEQYGGFDNEGNNAIEAVWQNEKFRRLYLRRLRTLMDQELKAPGTAEKDVPLMAKMREMYALMAADAKLDLEKYSDNGRTDGWSSSFVNNDVWGSDNWPIADHEEEGIKAGIDDIWTNYIVPRQTHLYTTHAAANHTEAEIGYATQLCAGIPGTQSEISVLKSKLTAEYDEAHAAVVIKNANAETIDLSGWTLAGRLSMTLPAGTVIDQGTDVEPAKLYIAADRRATVKAFKDDSTIADQVIVGNATANAGVEAIILVSDDGVRVIGEATDQELSIRLEAFYGNTNLDAEGTEGEWFRLKNVGSTAVDLADMTVCFLKDGDSESASHCHVKFDSKVGKLKAGESKTFNRADYLDKGWSRIQNNKQIITLYDRYGVAYQTLKVAQSDYPMAYGKGAFLEYSDDKWKQVWDGGDVTIKSDYLKKDLYVRAAENMTLTLDNPTYKPSSTLKISGEGTVTITGTLNATVNTTAIKSSGDLVFADGSYTITAGDDCIQADGDITINGGTFICHSTGNDGIDANGDIIINGGTIFAFTAANEALDGADPQYSTGLDVNTGHTITINGGTIIATSATLDALEKLTLAGSQAAKIVAVEGVSGQTKAIGDILVTFPAVEPTAVLVSKPGMTSDSTVEVEEETPGTVEIVAAVDGETPTPAVHATVPASWVADKEGDAKVAAAEAFVLGLAEPTEKPMVSSEQTSETGTIRIVDNVAPRFGTGVTVKRTLFVGTTPEASEESSAKESDNGFTVPLPTEGSKVKYIKIKYSFK